MDAAFVENAAKEYENSRSLKKIISSEVRSGLASVSEAFTSTLLGCDLRVELNSGRKTYKKYVVKTAPDDPKQQKYLSDYSFFKNEVEIYKTILISAERLMEEFGDKKEKLWCDFIGYRPDDLIILQDLKDIGYTMVPKTIGLDYEHTLLAVSSLGRFHALSKCLVEKGMMDGEKWRYNPLFEDEKLLGMFSTGGVIGFANVMKSLWGEDWTDVANRMVKSLETLESRFQKLSEKNVIFDVFNHGDLWTCNIMFKYHDFENTPVHAKLLDFQIAHYNSLAWDLTLLLYSSLKPSVRRHHYSTFINGYYNAFNATLDFYKFKGVRPNKQEVEREMDKFKFMGYVVLSSVYPATFSKIPDPFDMNPYHQEKGPYICYNPVVFQNEALKVDLKDDFDDFISEGII